MKIFLKINNEKIGEETVDIHNFEQDVSLAMDIEDLDKLTIGSSKTNIDSSATNFVEYWKKVKYEAQRRRKKLETVS